MTSHHQQTFKALHARAGGFIMPNAWDAGSAQILEAAGFEAIATTSAGIAFSLGKQDYAVTDPAFGVGRDEMFERMAQIVRAVDVPVNGDLEAGFGDSPEAVAETIAMAIEAGLAGGNIEDKIPGRAELYDEGLAVERIVAAREVINARGGAFVLTARTDAFQNAGDGIEAVVRRSNAYVAAGADLLFAPGAASVAEVTPLLARLDGPLNVVLGLGTSVGDARGLIAAGVKRISLGGAIARAALGFVRRCAEELQDSGSINFTEGQIGHAELNALFARPRARV